jgi:manganese transport protein
VDRRLLQLLVLSQVVLSFQLPFAIVPLVRFTSDRRRMGEFANGGWLKTLAWTCGLIVVGMNAVWIYIQMGKWAAVAATGGWNPVWVYALAGLLAVALAGFLGWVTVYPSRVQREAEQLPVPVPALPPVLFGRIGVAVEFEKSDAAVLGQAAALARAHGASLVIVHVVEGLGAAFYGSDTDDLESRADRARMAALAEHLREGGLEVQGLLGYGNPAEELVRLAVQERFDLLVLGTHGHRFFADLALGRTVSPVLHRLTIPVLVVPTRAGSDPALALPGAS